MSFNLSGYKAQAPVEGNFEPFKYEGAAKVNSAIVSVNGKVNTEFYPSGCNQFEMEVVVLGGENEGRKLWKRFNLDSTSADGKKGKTPVQKLADQLFVLGLEFTDLEGLKSCCGSLVDKNIQIKAWGAKFQDRSTQMWNIKGWASEKWEEESKAVKVSF